MRIESTLQVAKSIGIVAGKSAVRFMKIGMLNTAAYNLQEQSRNEVREVSRQLKQGYSEKVAPNINKFKTLKGGRK